MGNKHADKAPALAGKTPKKELHGLALGIERIGLVSLHFPFTVAFIAVVLALAAGFGVARLKVDDSLSQLFRSETAEFKQYAQNPAIRFLFTQTLRAGAGAAGALCLATMVSIASRGFLGRSGRGSTTPTSWRQRRREYRTRDHDVSGMTHPSRMKRAQRSRIAVNKASIAELIFKNVCLPSRTILPAV